MGSRGVSPPTDQAHGPPRLSQDHPSPTHYPFLTQDEDTKLVSLLYNYFSLGQFELGRATLTLMPCPNQKHTLLKSIDHFCHAHSFPCNWLTSHGIPSSAHMAWLCACEYESGPHLSHDGSPRDSKTHLPASLLTSLSYNILLHDALGDTGEENMVIEAALNELSLYQQQITSPNPKHINNLSDFALAQLSKIFTLFPLLGRVIFKYLDAPTPQKKISETVWPLHDIYIQIVNDMLGKQLYDEVYGYLQALHPPDEDDETPDELLRNSKELMNKMAGLCFKQKSGENNGFVSSPKISSRKSKGAPQNFKFVPTDSSLMSIEKVFEGFLQSSHISGLQKFCKEAASFVEESSHTSSVEMPMPFQVIEEEEAKAGSVTEETQRKFWYWYYHYASVNNFHFLEHTANRALALTNKNKITDANAMLLVFDKLRALVYLMSWDNFDDKVMAKLKLARMLWEGAAKTDPASHLLASKADQVTFQIRQAWWAVAHLYPELAGEDHLEMQANNKIVQELLAELKLHSLPYVVRRSLPTINPKEIVNMVQENPDASPNTKTLKDQDSDVLSSYNVLKHIISLFDPTTGEPKEIKQTELDSILSSVSQLLRNVRAVRTRLSLLEVLYLAIFMDTSHLRNAPDSETSAHPRTEQISEEHTFLAALSHTSDRMTSPNRYLFPPSVTGGLLETIESCLQDIKSNADVEIDNRANKFGQLVHEARTRFEIVTVMSKPSPLTEMRARDPKDEINAFMANMTAVPGSLLTSCMRAGVLAEQCERIIQFFSLGDHPLSQEARLAKQLADFEAKVQNDPSGDIASAFEILLSKLAPAAAFTTKADFAVTTASPSLSSALLAKIEKEMSASNPPPVRMIGDFIRLLSCLSGHFPSKSISRVLSNIKLLQGVHNNKGSVLLDSHLTFQKLAASNIEVLLNLVKDSSNKDPTKVMANMLKIVGALPGALYLHNFLEHVLALGEALGKRENSFDIIAQGPKQIVQELIFKNNLYTKAEELASILKLDLVGIIFSGLFQNNTREAIGSRKDEVGQKSQRVHQVLQPELVRYLGTNLPALATLVCVLRCPDPVSGSPTSIFTKAAADLTTEHPALHTWVQMHAEAKQLFWKTCHPGVTGGQLETQDDAKPGLVLANHRLDSQSSESDGSVEIFGLDNLPTEEKATYKLISNVEDIPDAFYSKIVDRLIASHALTHAVEIADRYLPAGAADWVLRVMAESCDNPSDSWVYVRRIKDKAVATAMVLKSYEDWDLDVCLDMLFMCKCHLNQISQQKPNTSTNVNTNIYANNTTPENNNVKPDTLQLPKADILQFQSEHKETVEHLYTQMQIFKSILSVDSSWLGKWQAIDEMVKRDPVLLIRKLLGIKQYVLARKIRELFVVPNIKSEIDESYLLHLLEQNDTSTALQTLMELGEDSIKIVEKLSDKIHENYSTKLFLVQFLMGNMSSALSTASYQALSTRETGIKVLLKLPKELQQQYAKLTDYPSLIIESLIMNEMAPQVHRLLSEIPNLRDDDMILKYASKALHFKPVKKVEPKPTPAPTPSTPTPAPPTTSPSTPSTPSTTTAMAIPSSTPTNSQTTPSRSSQPISIVSPSSSDISSTTLPDATPSSSYMQGTSVASSYMVNPTPLPPTNLMRSAGVTSTRSRTRRAKWHLVAPPGDAPVRAAHYFPAAPSISLAKALFDLVGDRRRAGQACLAVCTSLAQRLSAVYSDDNLLIISLIRQLLLYAKLQFMQDPRGGGSDGVATCDTFLGKVELFQELVIAKCTFNTSLEDLSDPQKARHLRDKLISSDRLKFAIDVATKCNILPDPAWLAWGLSLLSLGKYSEAREKFKYCLASATERRAASSTVTHPHSDMVDPASVLNKIVTLLETQTVPNPAYLRYVCDKLMNDPQNSKGGAYYEEMSVDSFLLAMHVGGGTPTKQGTPTKSSPATPTRDRPTSGGIISQKTSIDYDKYEEAVYYIRKYGTARGLINFQMRHGKVAEAISTLVSDNIPPNIFHEEMFLPCLSHGTIENLFDVAKKTNTSLTKLNPHLTHTCKMLFQAKHYHLLQIVQVFMGDPVRAGLTSIKMYMEQSDVADFEGKLKILEDAKRFFQEGLSSKSLVIQGAGAALPDAEIAKYAQTAGLQIEVTAFLQSQGKLVPPTAYKTSLFGPPAHKSEIAELLLVLYNFALAFKIMQDFRLPITTIYTNAICTMSRKKQAAKVNDLLKEIKGTCGDDEWDEIVLASIKVHVNELQDVKTAEKIASKLVGSRSKVIANILCGKRKAAYLQAVRDNDRALVQIVCKEAEKANDATIFGLCEKYLSQNS